MLAFSQTDLNLAVNLLLLGALDVRKFPILG